MPDLVGELKRGREAYAAQSWNGACESLSAADLETPPGPEVLEALAMSAYMPGREDDYLRALERAHEGYLDCGETLRGSAVRSGSA